MFEGLGLSEWVLKALEANGFSEPTEIQEKCIPLVMEGKDVVGRSKTGSGKTLAFGLPIIEKIDRNAEDGVQALVISPTRELAMQIAEEFRKITGYTEGCKVVPVFGGANMQRQIVTLKKAKIVVGTPGRLMDHIERRTLKLENIKTAVLDEADEMLDMGFREDIEKILKHTQPKRQTVMFSATMPPEIKEIANRYMTEPIYVEIGESNSTIETIEQTYIKVKRLGKKNALLELYKKLAPGQTIIFCNTKRMAGELSEFLNGNGIVSLALHGDMRQSERRKVMEQIKAHSIKTLVATDVAARGIDINDVEYVINYDLPDNVEYYIHRTGRTARAGKSGKAVSIINTKQQLKALETYRDITKSSITENPLAASFADYDNFTSEKSEKNASGENSGRYFKGRNEGERRDYKGKREWGRRDFNGNPEKREFKGKPGFSERRYGNAGANGAAEKPYFNETEKPEIAAKTGESFNYKTHGKPERKFSGKDNAGYSGRGKPDNGYGKNAAASNADKGNYAFKGEKPFEKSKGAKPVYSKYGKRGMPARSNKDYGNNTTGVKE